MAQRSNRKCKEFFSRFPEEKSSGVNFFAQQLSRDLTYYCFPPPGNLVPSLLHFMKFGAHGLLVFPDWRSASFWTFVAPDGVHFGSGIKSFVRFLPSGFDVEDGILSGTFKGVLNFQMFGVEFHFGEAGDNMEESVLAVNSCTKQGCKICR